MIRRPSSRTYYYTRCSKLAVARSATKWKKYLHQSGYSWKPWDRFLCLNDERQKLKSCVKSLSFALLPLIGRYLATLGVAAAIASLIVFSYASVAFSPSLTSTPKATWTINPLTFSFSAAAGSVSASDSVSCSPNAGFVQLRPKSSNPAKLALSASPPSVASCASSPATVTVTATCLVSANLCRGSYAGQVQVRQPANYRDIPATLKVFITVN